MYVLIITYCVKPENSLQRDVQIELKTYDRTTFRDLVSVKDFCSAKRNYIDSMNAEYVRCSKKVKHHEHSTDHLSRDHYLYLTDMMTLHFYACNDEFWTPDFASL